MDRPGYASDANPCRNVTSMQFTGNMIVVIHYSSIAERTLVHDRSCIATYPAEILSRLGTLTDKAVKTAKRRAAEATLGKVQIENNVLDNVYSFEYLGSRLQCDGDDEADVRYRMDIAQAAFAALSHLWMDHRLSRNTKRRLYNLCVCSTLTHSTRHRT